MDSRFTSELDAQVKHEGRATGVTGATGVIGVSPAAISSAPTRITSASKLSDLPGGSKTAKQICAVHSSKRDVRRVLSVVSAQAADQEHARSLVEALVSDTSYIPHNVRMKLQNLMNAGVLSDVIQPRVTSFMSRITRGCLGG